MLNAANEVAVHAFLDGRLGFMGIPAVIEGTLERGRRRARVHASTRSTRPTRAARAVAGELVESGARVSWLLAFLGFAVLIILHEAGHFTAAKAVGMRVERFSLFFPPLVAAQARRDRVRDRGDPARRLREDHRA